MKHKFLLTGLMLLLGLTVSAQTSGTCGENLTWTLENGTLTISGTGEMENYQKDNYAPWYSSRSSIRSVTISDGVTSIGNYAFYNCSSMTSVTIPNSVTSIGEYAFAWCISLTSVTIPNSVTSIGEWAFSYCNSLTSVTIPESVTSIGQYAFYGCSSLTSIKVEAANSAYCDIDGVLLNKDKTTLVQYPAGKTAASYTIPESVTSIGQYAFASCSSLTSVTIPNSVTSIGEWAFSNCSSLTFVTIPNSVTSIGDSAFRGCSSLTSVTIGNSVTSIGGCSFYGCSSLTSITCEAVNPPVCGNYVFYDVDKSIPLYVPANSMDAYKEAEGWKDFKENTKPISAEGVELPEDKLQTDASENGVVIEWPASTGADSYIITIKYNTAVVCVLTFDAEGRLLDIDIPHVAARDRRNAEAAMQTVKGWKYTIRGLNAETTYDYIVTAKNGSTELYSKGGTFKTKGTATGIEETDGENGKNGYSGESGNNGYSGRDGSAVKVMRDGVMYILMPDGTRYNAAAIKVK